MLLLVVTLGAACTTRDTVATAGGGDPVDTYCQQSGPPVLVDNACTGDLAEAVFRHAVCGCGQFGLGATVTTDGFDSRLGPYTPGGTGGHVGANQGLDSNGGGMLFVRGDVTVAGGNGIQAGPRLEVSGNLAVAGGLGRSSSAVVVGGTARVGGNVDVSSLNVTGTLTTTSGATVTGNVMAGSRVTAPVSVPPPCRCDASDIFDVGAIIDQHALANHDAAIGITPDELIDVDGDVTLELPCGRFFLNRVTSSGGGTVTIRATGRTALFIEGDVTLSGNLTVEVAPGAEMDLFIDGFLNLPGLAKLGDPTRPRDLRVYIGSAGSIAISGGLELAGNLYAPAADLQTSAPVDIYGAVLLNHWNLSAPANVHYDRAIEFAGDGCIR
ncbi:MAG TPA: collagen-binding domain-containing protein [Kofleriaceae bacterium]|nr:collagen-binding domain-containing protein [Kofleriaceae bacterium]